MNGERHLGLFGATTLGVGAIVRAPHRWRMVEAERVLVPLGGRRDHSHLRARLLASLSRSSDRSVTFLKTLPTATEPDTRRRFERVIRELAQEEAAGPYEVVFEYTDEPREAIIKRALDSDLVVMGIQRGNRGQPALGELPLAIAQETDVPLALIDRRPNRSPILFRTGLADPFSTRGILR
jgi:APA family basic amino acid/polyamine antiporter